MPESDARKGSEEEERSGIDSGPSILPLKKK